MERKRWENLKDFAERHRVLPITVSDFLCSLGFLYTATITWGESGPNTARIPTSRAFEKQIVRRKPGAKPGGRRGPWVWSAAFLDACWRNHEMPGRRGEHGEA